MNKLQETLSDLVDTKVKFVITRFDPLAKTHDDLDVLVKKMDFEKLVKDLEITGYKAISHDQALGGRVKGAQKNLSKKGRIKIDLHKDFTWRADKYLDLDLIWWNLKQREISGYSVLVPDSKIDAFLVLINIIFEKTYITKDEYDILWQEISKIKIDNELKQQAKKYGWINTYNRFLNWTNEVGEIKDLPRFLPYSLILYSYLEKLVKKQVFHFVSFLYYIYFRARYFVNKQLPYD